jgi:asparagine synthase (glutamine-hydrolysing)
MSQPILEFCLRMPTWLWFEGGINRAIVRKALSGILPPELLARTSKAGPDSFIRRAFDHHRIVLRERLLGGLLERNGIIDREEVEQALATDITTRDSIIYRLLDLAEAENWARSWT